MQESKFVKLSRNLFCNRHWIACSVSAIILIASSLSLCGGANASEVQRQKNKTVELYMKKYEKNNVVYYSGSSLAKTARISSEAYFKGSPFVCTPSGFGRMSHCRNRNAF